MDDPPRPPLEKAPFNFKTAKFEYKVICWKLAKTDSPLKSREFTDVCMVGGTNLPPFIQTTENFGNFPALQCIFR